MSPPDNIGETPANGRDGDPDALGRLSPLVYKELHSLAEAYMRQERTDHTLQPTALIHEAYLRLAGEESGNWQNRAHFFAVAAQAMRQILVNHAKHRHRAKRGGGRKREPFRETLLFWEGQGLDLVALDEALAQLAAINPEHARLVELRFFGGLTIQETAEVLGISTAGVERHWRSARAWLYRRLTKGDTRPGGRHRDGE